MFVRHGESHANVAPVGLNFISRKWLIPPLCTMKGWSQSYQFGQELQCFLASRGMRLCKTLRCTRLPRTMATAYGINAGLGLDLELRCVPFMEEQCRIIEYLYSGSTANTAIPADTRKYLTVLERMARSSLNIEDLRTLDLANGPRYQREKGNYQRFVETVIPELEPDTVNIVICHGGVIEDLLHQECPDEIGNWHGDNLESVLIEYPTGTLVGRWKPSPVTINEKDLKLKLFREPAPPLSMESIKDLIEGTYTIDEITLLSAQINIQEKMRKDVLPELAEHFKQKSRITRLFE